MQPNGTVDLEDTLHAWADITLKIWHDRLTDLQIYHTGALYESLKNALLLSAGNDGAKIEFSFKLYGIFVDMGTGREIPQGNSGDLGFRPIRKRKEWYSRVFYREVMILKKILIEKFGEGYAESILFALKPRKDLKYDHAKGLI